MVQLRDDIKRFTSTGVQIVGFSYDSVDILNKFSDSQGIPFLLLSDGDSKTIQAYGLHFKDGLPHPGTVLVDQDGVIRAKLFEECYVTRHSNDELVAAIETLR